MVLLLWLLNMNEPEYPASEPTVYLILPSPRAGEGSGMGGIVARSPGLALSCFLHKSPFSTFAGQRAQRGQAVTNVRDPLKQTLGQSPLNPRASGN